MTVTELLKQAEALSQEERKELAKRLIDMIGTVPKKQGKTGAEITDTIENKPFAD